MEIKGNEQNLREDAGGMCSIVKHIDRVADDALSQGISLPDPARFELKLFDGQFYAAERDSAVGVCLKSLCEQATSSSGGDCCP